MSATWTINDKGVLNFLSSPEKFVDLSVLDTRLFMRWLVTAASYRSRGISEGILSSLGPSSQAIPERACWRS